MVEQYEDRLFLSRFLGCYANVQGEAVFALPVVLRKYPPVLDLYGRGAKILRLDYGIR